jgi:exodeoxyribonuclease-3
LICLAELFLVRIRKMPSCDFPDTELLAAGYYSVFTGQQTYNGVAILSREQASDVQTGIPGYEDEQKRVITATFGDVRVVCVYISNGQSPDSDKYQYKLGLVSRPARLVKR